MPLPQSVPAWNGSMMGAVVFGDKLRLTGGCGRLLEVGYEERPGGE